MKELSEPSTNLGHVIGVVEEMIAEGIISEYAIGGAVAAILHYEPFSTIDLDIFFCLAERPTGLILSLEKIYDFARRGGFSFDSEFIMIHGWPVQFVEASNSPLWLEAITTSEVKSIDGSEINVIDPEHLAAMWILAGRKKDIRKIETFDEAGILNVGKLLSILRDFGLLDRWKIYQHNFSDEYHF